MKNPKLSMFKKYLKCIAAYMIVMMSFAVNANETIDVEQNDLFHHNVDYTSDITFYILQAELADKRGDFELASHSYFQAAEQSGLAQLGRKASYYSLRRGLFVEAWDSALVWLQSESSPPRSAQPRIVLGLALLGIDRIEPAIEQFKLALAETDDLSAMYRQLSNELSTPTNVDGLAIFDELTVQKNFRNHLNRAYLALRLKKVDEALMSTEEALLLDPSNEDAAILKFNIFYIKLATQQQDLRLKKPSLEDSLPDSAEFVGSLQTSSLTIHEFADDYLKRNSTAVNLRERYASYLTAEKKFAEALHQYQLLFETETKRSDLYHAAMVLAVELENYQLAEGYAQFLKEQPGYEERTLLFLCELNLQQFKLDQAQKNCEAVSDPEYYFPAQMMLSEIMSQQGRLEQALHFLSDISVIEQEKQIQVVLQKQRLLFEAHHYHRAKGVLDAALTSHEGVPALLYARGIVLAELGYTKAHENDLRKVIELQPNNAHAYNSLGYTLADQTDRFDEALLLIEKANELRPNDPYILDSLGWVKYRLNEFESAVNYLKQAYEIKADAATAAHLGEVYWMMGNQSEAKDIWKQGLKVDPDSPLLNKTILRFTQ